MFNSCQIAYFNSNAIVRAIKIIGNKDSKIPKMEGKIIVVIINSNPIPNNKLPIILKGNAIRKTPVFNIQTATLTIIRTIATNNTINNISIASSLKNLYVIKTYTVTYNQYKKKNVWFKIR
jgi:hypothetical protein